MPSSEAVSKVMRGNRKTESRPETRLRRELHRRGLRYRKNPALRTSIGSIRPDLALLGPRVAVFVDGCFWHSCPLHGNKPGVNRSYWEPKLRRNRERDRLTTDTLAQEGWLVLRIWEHEPPSDAATTVEAAVKSRQKQISPTPG
jgi:DNA mismatch endonuclease, patch repair protein